jgi:hypothetical protein|tara:strand:+ start:968 stop:1165 length:198 start_codon:yes stop_codon:yes gene_type:complete
LEQDDGVLGFSKTNIRFEEREFDRKLANGHAELVFWRKYRIIRKNSIDALFAAKLLDYPNTSVML